MKGFQHSLSTRLALPLLFLGSFVLQGCKRGDVQGDSVRDENKISNRRGNDSGGSESPSNSSRNSPKTPRPDSGAKLSVSLIEAVTNDPESIRDKLDQMGPGEARRNHLKSMMLELVIQQDSTPEVAIKFLKIIDGVVFPEDSGALMTGVWELTRKLDIDESTRLIGELNSPSLRQLVASGAAKALAKRNEIPMPNQFSSLDRASTETFLVTFGSEIKFESLDAFSDFVTKHGKPESPFRSMVLSSLSESQQFNHQEIIDKSFSISDGYASGQIFEYGMSRFIKHDPLKASSYLIENKSKLGKKRYASGAKLIADYLDVVGDTASAADWRKESTETD